jgi:enoyl-CoA hydratase/carnithine racemase
VSGDEVEFARSGAVAVITINRPARLNALDRRAAQRLTDLIDHVEEDDDARVPIITGSGDRAFCAGTDLSEPSAAPSSASVRAGALVRFVTEW